MLRVPNFCWSNENSISLLGSSLVTITYEGVMQPRDTHGQFPLCLLLKGAIRGQQSVLLIKKRMYHHDMKFGEPLSILIKYTTMVTPKIDNIFNLFDVSTWL